MVAVHDGVLIGLFVSVYGMAHSNWDSAGDAVAVRYNIVRWVMTGIFAGIVAPLAYELTHEYVWAVAGASASIITGTKAGELVHSTIQRRYAANAWGRVMRENGTTEADDRVYNGRVSGDNSLRD